MMKDRLISPLNRRKVFVGSVLSGLVVAGGFALQTDAAPQQNIEQQANALTTSKNIMSDHYENQKMPKNQIQKNKIQGISHPLALVELFTSQGCSSCPPSNALVGKIENGEDVLALSYSVDYWDYLGWKDTLGKPEFSKRQRQYGTHFKGQVYTPQIILSGQEHAPRYSVDTMIRPRIEAPSISRVLSVMIKMDGETQHRSVKTKPKGFDQPVRIVAVHYKPGTTSVNVGAGENRGRRIELSNTVQKLNNLADLDRGQNFEAALPEIIKGHALAIIVQSQKDNHVIEVIDVSPPA